jgi:zinc transporter, ZIP family
VIEAAFWGFLAASALVIAAELSFRFELSPMLIGLIMAFGVGTLLSSIAYELVAEALAAVGDVVPIAAAIIVGSVAFFIGDRLVAGMGGAHRKSPGAKPGRPVDAETSTSSGRGIALGTALDGIPESAVLGMSLAGGGTVSVALLVAIWVSNFPESLGSTVGLTASGVPRSRIRLLWWAIVALSAVAAALGYLLVSVSDSQIGALFQAFSAGALLAMILDELAPEAFVRSALYTGLAGTAGFVLTIVLIGLE